MRRHAISLILAVLVLCTMRVAVLAHDVPDLSRSGSIEITMSTGTEPVPGGSLTIYRVGEIEEKDGNYSFVLTEAFRPSELELENLQSPQLAAALAEFVKKNPDIPGETGQIGKDGRITFSVELGLYLVIQQQAAEGYLPVSPFLVAVPNMENGSYVYGVDASPKVVLTPAPTVPTPTEPEPTKPTGPQLPQTGQLDWPIPLLAVLGLSLFVVGWLIRFGGRKA